MSIIAPRSTDAFFKEETPRIKKHKGLNRMSKKRKYESRQYTKLRKAFLEENPICQMKVQCEGGRATEVHHRKLRGPHYLDVSSFMAACFYCHAYVHSRPNEARKLGLLA